MKKTKILAAVVLVSLLLTLSILQWIVPGVVERGINRVSAHEAYLIRPEVQAFHDQLFIADLHSDSLLWKRNLLEASDRGHVDLPRLRQGNVALQVFSATTKSPSGQNYNENTADSDDITKLAMSQLWPIATWSSLFARADYQLEKLKRFAADSQGKLVVITNQSEMAAFVAARLGGEKTIAGIYLIEGAHPLEGDLKNLDRLFDQGLRIAGLTHFFDNRLGGSLHGTSGAGLTPFGKAVITRANELGIIIDVAHASPQMVKDVLDMNALDINSKPLILSHGGVKGVCDVGRNLDDALMQRIAAAGGIVGIGFWDGAVCDSSPMGVVKSIRYAIDLIGIDHVALGSDYDGATEVAFVSSELAVLTQTMMDEGFTETEIQKVMGENVMQFMLNNLPAGGDGN